jgi:hypothetical protein
MSRRMSSRSATWLLVAATLGVCAAQTSSLDPAAAGSVLTLNGQVSVLRGSIPWALHVGDQVRPQQVILTGPDGFAVLQVSDGSRFEIFPNSRVIFRNNPGDWKDLLDMLIGRVKVYIQKLGGQPNPNSVRTPTAVISVRGTVFDVTVEDQDATTFVMVEEGQVAVRHLLKGGEPKLLNQGEWLRIYKNEPLARKLVERDSIIRAAMRAISDALYTVVYRSPGGAGPVQIPGGPAGTGGGLPTDKPAPAPPPPPGGGDPTAPPPPPPPGS